jgi:two-component system KDP operon response regulator KdpE
MTRAALRAVAPSLRRNLRFYRCGAQAGRSAKLSRKEYDILSLLVVHAGKVLTHQFILREVWKTPTDVQYLRIYIKQLRQKIEPDPQEPRYILTEMGVGYRLHEPD